MYTEKPLISVIIPTYDRALLISRAIDSVLKQTYKNIEIIVVDDGSTDNTGEIILSYLAGVKYFHKKNGGVSSARNMGIKQSSGEYIAFLDSDDLWYPTKIEKQLDFLSKNKILDSVMCEIEFSDENGIILNKIIRSEEIRMGELGLKDLISNFKTVCTILVKKHIFDGIGYFDEKLTTAEDIDMLFRIASKFKIGYISEPLVKVISNKSSNSKSLYTGNRLVALKKIKQYAPSFAEKNRKIILSAEARVYLSYGKDLLWHRHIRESQIQILESMKKQASLKAFLLYGKSMVFLFLSVFIVKYRNKDGIECVKN